MAVRLWHDDVRPAPEGWLWAVTNGDAAEILMRENVVECSLDYDLGFHNTEWPDDPDEFVVVAQLKNRQGSETGLDLVEWMVQNGKVPERVTIHSWNPPGAQAMAAMLNRFGHSVTVSPFKP